MQLKNTSEYKLFAQNNNDFKTLKMLYDKVKYLQRKYYWSQGKNIKNDFIKSYHTMRF